MLAIPDHLKQKVKQTFRRQQLLWLTTLSWRPTWRRLLQDSTQSWDRPKEMTRSSKTFPISILSLLACLLWSPTTAGRQSVEKMEDLICWLQVGEASEAAAPTGRHLAGPVERTHVDHQVWQVLRKVDKLASWQVLRQDVVLLSLVHPQPRPVQQRGVSCRSSEPLQQRRCFCSVQQRCKWLNFSCDVTLL